MYFDFWRDPANNSYIFTNCSKSLIAQAWYSEEQNSGCLKAENLKPVLNETINHFITNDSPYSITKKTEIQSKFVKSVANYSGDMLPKSFDWRNHNNKSYVLKAGD